MTNQQEDVNNLLMEVAKEMVIGSAQMKNVSVYA